MWEAAYLQNQAPTDLAEARTAWIITATADTTLGPLMGREVANSALRGYLRQDLQMFSVERFN